MPKDLVCEEMACYIPQEYLGCHRCENMDEHATAVERNEYCERCTGANLYEEEVFKDAH